MEWVVYGVLFWSLRRKSNRSEESDCMDDAPTPATRLLQNLDLASPAQAEELLQLVYAELRALAAGYLRREQAAYTLQPTALVHEAYLRMVGARIIDWQGRAHFFGIAARTMRQILVDHARQRQSAKRGGGAQHVTIRTDLLGDDDHACGILDLHEALQRLSSMDQSTGQLVELRFFAGMTLDEAAAAVGVSRRKAAKDWSVARLWLSRELSRD
jgi:RNA polymerase sigma factor (TIGR02999 family)